MMVAVKVSLPAFSILPLAQRAVGRGRAAPRQPSQCHGAELPSELDGAASAYPTSRDRRALTSGFPNRRHSAPARPFARQWVRQVVLDVDRFPPQTLLPDPLRMPEGEAATTRLNGVDIFYQVFGDGSPVLLLHGGLSNGDCWVNVIPELTAAGYQAVVMDSRGHGRSTFDQRPITYELMASDVLALMDRLGIERAGLVGWSDGAIIGLQLALTHPERLNRVVA